MLCLILSKERKNIYVLYTVIYIYLYFLQLISLDITLYPYHHHTSYPTPPTKQVWPSWPNTCTNRNKGPKYETKRKLRGAQGPHERNKLRIVTMPETHGRLDDWWLFGRNKNSLRRKKTRCFFGGREVSWVAFKGEWCVFFWLFFWWGWFCFGVMFQRMCWLLGG